MAQLAGSKRWPKAREGGCVTKRGPTRRQLRNRDPSISDERVGREAKKRGRGKGGCVDSPLIILGNREKKKLICFD